MMILLLLAGVAAAKAPPVVVSSLTTAQLVDSCRGKDTDASATFCTGYIMGEFDTLSVARQICPSAARASTVEAVGFARKYLRDHPERWKSAPSFVVRDALRATFPCRKRK